MPSATPLSPAESLCLFKRNRVTGYDTIKVTLLMLLAKGVLRMEETEEIGIFRNKKVAHLRIAAEPKDPPPEIAALLDLVRAVQPGGKMKDLVKRAGKDFGPACMKFNHKLILPALVARGLATEKKGLLIHSFPLTPAGEAERTRIEAEIAKARQIPALLKTDPAQAAAIALSLGSTLLIADEMKKYYKPLADAMRVNGSGSDTVYIASDGASHGDAFSGSFDFSSFDLGSFDIGSFGALDAGMASFDAGFSDGGGGGDSGGGGHSH